MYVTMKEFELPGLNVQSQNLETYFPNRQWVEKIRGRFAGSRRKALGLRCSLCASGVLVQRECRFSGSGANAIKCMFVSGQ